MGDTMKDVSPNIRKAIERNLSVFNNERVLEISHARDSKLNGLYYEVKEETVDSPRRSGDSLDYSDKDEKSIKFSRDDGSSAVLKREKGWKDHPKIYSGMLILALEVDVMGSCYAAAYQDENGFGHLHYSRNMHYLWYGFERGTTPPGSVNGRKLSDGQRNDFAAHPWAILLVEHKENAEGPLLRTRVMWRDHEGELL